MAHAYPSMNLQQAIEGVRSVYDGDHRNPMTAAVVASHLGYEAISGSSAVAISALKKYGLLEGRGDSIRVTDDAVTILVDDDDSPERRAALQRCAMQIPMFRELSERFGDSGSDRNLAVYLEKQGLTRKVAERVVSDYRDTMLFLSESGASYNPGSSRETPDPERRPVMMPDRRTPQGSSPLHRDVPIPLPNGDWPVLRAVFPMTEDAWQQMMAVLAAMKPGLVRPPETQVQPPETQDGGGNSGNEGGG